MGGAIGTTLFKGGKMLSTAASLLGGHDQEQDYYRSLAYTAEAQAAQIAENARRNGQYLWENAAYENNALLRDYTALAGRQKTALAANGIGAGSATAQKILQTSRLYAQLDQKMLAENLNRALYENDTQARLQAQQYRTQSSQYRTIAKRKSLGFWSQLGDTLGRWIRG
ncbi:MAG: hypothetical protein IKC13_00145 [Elusimicrobiaceae bacterium]|nr:hypothetical protein [Elusimicrobiaceae bacterium]